MSRIVTAASSGRSGGMTTPQPTRSTSWAVSLSASAATIAGLPVAMIPYRRLGTTYPESPCTRPTKWTSAAESDKGSTSRGWYGRNFTRSTTSSRSASPTISPCRAPKPTMTILMSSRSRRKVADRTSTSRFCAWPTFPECMTTNVPTSPCCSAHSLSRDRGDVSFVSTQLGMTRMRSAGAPFSSSRSRIVSPIATTRSARVR